MADFGDQKLGFTSTQASSSDHAGPIIQESQKSQEYQQDLQIVLGTVFGFVAIVGLLALTFLLYKIRSARHATSSSGGATDDHVSLEHDFTIEVDDKSEPVVLLLYAYDCLAHENVVQALTRFLGEACGFPIVTDILQERDILERGVEDWLLEKLQEADFIIVLCSLGARLRCSKRNLKFKSDSRRRLPDYFALAVDYVIDKMRVEKQKGLNSTKFIAAYMDYSTRSDVPPQLETTAQLCLMKDIGELFNHLTLPGVRSNKEISDFTSGPSDITYDMTHLGAILKASIDEAKKFFRENPSWMDETIDHDPSCSPIASGHGPKKKAFKYSLMDDHFIKLSSSQPPSRDSEEVETKQCHRRESSSSQTRSSSKKPQLAMPGRAVTAADNHDHLDGSPFSKSTPFLQSGQLDLPNTEDDHIDSDHRIKKKLNSKMSTIAHKDRNRDSRLQLMPSPTKLSLQYKSDSFQPPTSNGCNKTQLEAEIHQDWIQSRLTHSDQESMPHATTHDTHSKSEEVISPLNDQRGLNLLYPVPARGTNNSSLKNRRGHSEDDLHLENEEFKFGGSVSSKSSSVVDSESLSDLDCLEQDLQSIQNIASFQDLLNSSSAECQAADKTRSLPTAFEAALKLRHLVLPLSDFSDFRNSSSV